MKQRYPNLGNFLGAYIADEDADDFEIARKFVLTEMRTVSSALVKESHEILLEDNFPWQELSKAANRYFENSEDAREWLNELISGFESVSPRDDKASQPRLG
jgi:hypothetical protein